MDAALPYPIEVQQEWRTIEDLHYSPAAWGQAEGTLLVEAMRRELRVPILDEDVTADDVAHSGVVTRALVAFGERVAAGLPIERDVELMLRAEVIASLRHPHWLVRHSALATVNMCGLLLDKDVRSMVEAMADDPHPGVAALARQIRKNLDFPNVEKQWRDLRKHRGL